MAIDNDEKEIQDMLGPFQEGVRVTLTLTYEKVEYRLFIPEMILFRGPKFLGKWLDGRGYAVVRMVGVRGTILDD